MKNMKINKKYIFILIAVFIMSITLILNTYINNREEASSNMTSVIAVNQDIEANTTINKEMLAYKTVSKEELTEDMYVNPENVIGMKSLVPLYKGEVINKKRLSNFDSDIIDKDFAVKIDSTDKALNLLPGTFIDIWKTPTKEGFETGLESERIFSGLYVIDVKNEAYASYKDFNAKKGDSSDAGIFTPDYIVLNLDEANIKTLTNLNSKNYSLRITLHKDNLYYDNLKDMQKEKSVNKEDISSNSENETESAEESLEIIPQQIQDQTLEQVTEEGDTANEDN